MYPTSFEYVAPRDLTEAVKLLDDYGEDAKLLSGGQSLVPLMKLRLVRPTRVIDLNRLSGLDHIRQQDGEIHCGAMTRHVQFEESDLLAAKFPLICEAASHIGDFQVRNRGTIGGALAEADPAGDWGPVVLALNARIKCVGPEGERVIEARDFFTFAYTTALERNEVLSEVIFPPADVDSAGVYLKLERVAGDFAVASVAVQLTVDGDGVCRKIGVGLGGASTVPLKAHSAENLLAGRRISPQLIEETGGLVFDEADPVSDLRGSSEYKKEILKVSVKRALRKAIQRLERKRR